MKSDSVTTFVISMLVLQVVSVALLWILNVLSSESTGVFAILLAANLIAFAVVLQTYRNPDSIEKDEPAPSAPPVAQPAPEKPNDPTTKS